jgi:hypothetical protein
MCHYDAGPALQYGWVLHHGRNGSTRKGIVNKGMPINSISRDGNKDCTRHNCGARSSHTGWRNLPGSLTNADARYIRSQ